MLPDRFESGTPNGAGIAGLGAGVRFVTERGIDAIRAHECALTHALIDGLGSLPGIMVYGPDDVAKCECPRSVFTWMRNMVFYVVSACTARPLPIARSAPFLRVQCGLHRASLRH